MTRVLIADFGIIQKVLANAVVTFYKTDANGENTGVLAPLYQASTGAGTMSNPQTLDDNGMLANDCFIDAQIMAAITGIGALTERSIKKVRDNPLEYSLPVTSSNWAKQASQDLFSNLTAVQSAVASANADAVQTAADRVQTGLDVTSAGGSATTATTEAGIATAQAVIATAKAVLTAADRVQTGLDVTSTGTNAATATTQAGIATTQQGIATAQAVISTAQAVVATAAALSAASNLTATSTTSNTIGTGSFSFTTQANKNFFPGQFIVAASHANGTNYIHGQVTSYSGTSLVMTESDNGGSGAHIDWDISASSPQGTSGSGSGTVTSASVATANGFAGTVANQTTTPAITIKTTVTGLLKGDGTAVAAATAGTDYLAPSGDAGTPSAIVLTNATGTASGATAGKATALATARAIYGNNFDGTAALDEVIASTYGGTGNGFTKLSGPTTAEKTKTLRDANDTILELGGSYTPTGTWTGMVLATPALGTPASGVISNCTTDTVSAKDNSTKPASTAYVDRAASTIPKNAQSADYTTVLGDAGYQVTHPTADTSARTYTIDSNANVAYPVGTTITFVNEYNAGVVTIAITSDVMYLAGASNTTGSRTLTAVGEATALKVESTVWIISGAGLT